ncbi:MAG: hypothetical protein V1787_02595 [Candidatus Micrarchaeota archaeon]
MKVLVFCNSGFSSPVAAVIFRHVFRKMGLTGAVRVRQSKVLAHDFNPGRDRILVYVPDMRELKWKGTSELLRRFGKEPFPHQKLLEANLNTIAPYPGLNRLRLQKKSNPIHGIRGCAKCALVLRARTV